MLEHRIQVKKVAKLVSLLALFLFAAPAANADDASQCQANKGAYLIGTVTSGPVFVHGHPQKGVELSHTHLTLRADQDSRLYDVAIDNVFASGYDAAREVVPTPLSTIAVGDRLELCGKLYTQGGPGIDWVHTNCGNTPTAAQPDGWLKVVSSAGTPGPNLENSQEYCRLWP
jgi:hypothetical protein